MWTRIWWVRPVFELALDAGDVPAFVAEAGFHRVVGDGLAPILADGLLEAIGGVAAEWRLDGAAGLLGATPGQAR